MPNIHIQFFFGSAIATSCFCELFLQWPTGPTFIFSFIMGLILTFCYWLS